MNSDLETELQPAMNKRTRFSDNPPLTSSPKINEDTLRSPKETASSFIRGTFASLNPKLATILTKTAENHLSLLHKLFEKKRQHTRMTSDPEFIPSSARSNEFEFYVRKPVENSPDFRAIQEITREGSQKPRLFLKEQILSVMAIDISLLEKDINDDYLHSLDIALRGHLISLNRSPDERHRYLTEVFNEHHVTLLSRTTMSYEDFCSRYQDMSESDLFPLEPMTQPVTSPHFGGSQNGDILLFQQQTIAIRDTCVPILAMLKSLLVTPFERYQEQVSQNDLNINLKKLSTEHFSEKATTDTSLLIDLEESADKTQLRELIRQENQLTLKKLTDEITELKNQVKEQRGRNRGASSSKKQIPTTTTEKTQKKPNPTRKKKKKAQSAQKADARDNGSSSATKKSSKKKGKKNSTRKSRPSRTERK